jgi:hypothetical protein
VRRNIAGMKGGSNGGAGPIGLAGAKALD